MIIIQKFVILAALLGCLGLSAVESNNNVEAPMLRCCSYCDQHLGAPECDSGCNNNCFNIQ